MIAVVSLLRFDEFFQDEMRINLVQRQIAAKEQEGDIDQVNLYKQAHQKINEYINLQSNVLETLQEAISRLPQEIIGHSVLEKVNSMQIASGKENSEIERRWPFRCGGRSRKTDQTIYGVFRDDRIEFFPHSISSCIGKSTL